jgi:site-specific recombinase XerD
LCTRCLLPSRFPTDEVTAVLSRLQGDKRLIAVLLYGGGLRLLECLRLRVQDIDFAAHQILVRDGKGNKDWLIMLPESATVYLQEHLSKIRGIHQQDLAEG